MEIINKTTGFPLRVWEEAIDKMQDIELDEVRLYRGKVTGAIGRVLVGNQKFNATWIFDGRCFIRAKRAKLWDVKL